MGGGAVIRLPAEEILRVEWRCSPEWWFVHLHPRDIEQLGSESVWSVVVSTSTANGLLSSSNLHFCIYNYTWLREFDTCDVDEQFVTVFNSLIVSVVICKMFGNVFCCLNWASLKRSLGSWGNLWSISTSFWHINQSMGNIWGRHNTQRGVTAKYTQPEGGGGLKRNFISGSEWVIRHDMHE